MNYTNWLKFFRQVKNAPATSTAERVYEAYPADQGVSGVVQDWKTAVITQTVSIAAAASVALSQVLPAGARVKAVSIFFETSFTLTTAVKVGVGYSGSPSAFYLSGTTMTQGVADAQASADSTGRVTTATTVLLSTCATGGTAAGTGTGTAKVSIVYEYLALPTA